VPGSLAVADIRKRTVRRWCKLLLDSGDGAVRRARSCSGATSPAHGPRRPAAAGLTGFHGHDLRHTGNTRCKAKIDWKALSKRIGHADVAFTMKQYVQTDLDADREVANLLADLIIGGLLVTEDTAVDDDQADTPDQAEET